MRGKTIERGLIVTDTFPWKSSTDKDDVYRATSFDYKAVMFIKEIEGLEPYFEEASRDDNRRYVPCVVGSRTHPRLRYYNAKLLAPPDTKEDSELFVPGLIVPDLEIGGTIVSASECKGFIMHSEYLGGQKFYVPPIKMLKDIPTSSNVRFQGKIVYTNKGDKKLPFVYITMDSRDDPEIFLQNRKELERIKMSEENFWWKIKLDGSQSDFL